jgi:A118 family predicted phage portal protein
MQTATEVVSSNSMTYQTRSSYLTMVEKAINELVHSIFELSGYGELFPSGQAAFTIDYDSYQVAVSFDDGVFVNKDAQLEDDLKVAAAGFMPKRQFLIRNYGLSKEEAEDWLNELQDEQSANEPVHAPQEDALLNGGD